jgi:hypothetical protein
MFFQRICVWAALGVGLAALEGCAGNQSSIPNAAGASTISSAAADKAPNFKTNFGGFFQDAVGKHPSSAVFSGSTIGVDSTGDCHGTFTQTVVFSSKPNQIKNGKFTFVWEDGSSLSGRYSGTETSPAPNGYTNGRGKFTVTAGTGRFSDARGHAGTFTVSALIFLNPSGGSPAGVINTTFAGRL